VYDKYIFKLENRLNIGYIIKTIEIPSRTIQKNKGLDYRMYQ